MAAIVRSWIRAFCPSCDTRKVFMLEDDWVLVCDTCGCKKQLEPNGLLAGV